MSNGQTMISNSWFLLREITDQGLYSRKTENLSSTNKLRRKLNYMGFGVILIWITVKHTSTILEQSISLQACVWRKEMIAKRNGIHWIKRGAQLLVTGLQIITRRLKMKSCVAYFSSVRFQSGSFHLFSSHLLYLKSAVCYWRTFLPCALNRSPP